MNHFMQLILVGFLWAGITLPAFSQILIVSDIDDTIKISHVLDRPDALLKAARTSNLFLGSNYFYQFLYEKYKNIGVEFVYLSTAPRFLMETSHSNFLKHNNFPGGSLILPSSLMQIHNHKINTLREILNARHYQQVILIGDNGERDIEIYDQIKNEFPGFQYLTFIHQVYFTQAEEHQGKALLPMQVGFVTPIEIAISLKEKDLLSQIDLVNIENKLIPEIVNSSL